MPFQYLKKRSAKYIILMNKPPRSIRFKSDLFSIKCPVKYGQSLHMVSPWE